MVFAETMQVAKKWLIACFKFFCYIGGQANQI